MACVSQGLTLEHTGTPDYIKDLIARSKPPNPEQYEGFSELYNCIADYQRGSSSDVTNE